MTGFLPYTRVLLRTQWPTLVIWPTVVATLLTVTAAKLVGMYPDQAGRDAYADAYRSASGLAAFQGRGHDLGHLGGILTHEMGYLALLMLPVIGVHLAIRLTRTIEDTGRLDLVTSGRVARLTPLLVGAGVATLPAMAVAGLSTAVLLGLGYPAGGSVGYALALGLLLLVFVAVGLLAAQLASGAPQAYLLGLTVCLVCYLLRAVIDVRGSGPTWTDPGSWFVEARPFATDPPLWPWLAGLGAVAVLTTTAVRIAAWRDQGAGVLVARQGPSGAAEWVRGPLGVGVRLTLRSALAWAVGAGTFAFAFGLLADDMRDLVERTQGGEAGLDPTLALYVRFDALFAMAVGVAVVGSFAREEGAGRAGLVLATAVGRGRAGGAVAVIAMGWSLVVLAWTGALSGLGLLLGTGRGEYLWHGLASTLAYAPAVVLVVALTLLAVAVSARAATFGWVMFGWALVVSFLGDLLDLAGLLRRLSPLEWIGDVPVDHWHPWTGLAMVVLTSAGLYVAAGVYRRRDLVAG